MKTIIFIISIFIIASTLSTAVVADEPITVKGTKKLKAIAQKYPNFTRTKDYSKITDESDRNMIITFCTHSCKRAHCAISKVKETCMTVCPMKDTHETCFMME